MKINFSEVILDINGKTMKVGGPDSEDATIGFICREALLRALPNDDKLSGDDKYSLWQIALKCKDEADLKIEEVVKIKERIGKTFSPAVLGPVFDKLDK